MTARLSGRTALVTGAGSGIGRQVAERFAAEGARVVFADRDEAAVRDAAAGVSGAVPIVMDIADEPTVEAAFAEVARGGLSIDLSECVRRASRSPAACRRILQSMTARLRAGELKSDPKWEATLKSVVPLAEALIYTGPRGPRY